MDRRSPPQGSETPAQRPAVAARLVTSAPNGLLRLDFSAPPTGTWTLVRAELARRLAEQAVSTAAAVNEADLTAFAMGRRLRLPGNAPAPSASKEAIGAALPPGGQSTGLAAARAAILRRPEMLTGDALAGRLGVSRATVALRRTAGRLLALELGTKRGFRYPAWQADLVADPQKSGLFEAMLRALGSRGSWAAYAFFTDPSAALADRSPLDAFAAGDVDAIRELMVRVAGRRDTA